MYGDSHALSSDSGPIYSPNPKPEEHLAASPNNPDLWFLFMESDTNSNFSEYRPQFSSSNSSQINSGMLKYMSSAPSFLLESFTNNGVREKCTGRLSSRFCFDDENSRMNDVCSNNGSSGIGAQLPPQYPSQNVGRLGSLAVDGGGFSAVAVSSMGIGNQVLQEKMGPNVLRQNSTPAGFFSNLTPEHAYGSIRSGTGSYKIPDCVDNNGDLSPCSSRPKNRNIFFSGTLSQISEVENRPDDAKAGSGSDHDSQFGFPFGSWNDSSNFAENFSTGIKRELDDDPHKLFGDTLNKEPGNRSNTLSRHLSLPKTSSEMEKLLQLQDMVPCKIRAKRGCATHPRSIAERLRRTRISERMRKLQELVPNMDKQTNTTDMLDMAVEYIKNLREQYKALCEHRANCKCSTSHKMVQNQRP